MNAKQLCVVSIALAATFAAVAPIASATCDRTAVSEARAGSVLRSVGVSVETFCPTRMRGSDRHIAHVDLSWWKRWY